MKNIFVLLITLFLFASLLYGQGKSSNPEFTRKDSLKGYLNEFRSCYDVIYYELDVRINPKQKSIYGSNKIRFRSEKDFNKFQIDLFENMKISDINFENTSLNFTREFDAVFIEFPKTIKANTVHEITVFYGGKPIEAKSPPWIGGVVWSKDDKGNPLITTTTQGTGASCWWPLKDHQSDEPDSMLISVTVPSGLMDVSNGKLLSVNELKDGKTKYEWFVSYPINSYNVVINVGKYEHFSDVYKSQNFVKLDYYVLPENLIKAQKHFKQVKKVLKSFEKHFGEYPFILDGYKLIESSHWGMEHQSAVAYGNKYVNGMMGQSRSKYGILFDFIIVHESAHEWWGNSITSSDIADSWIHESFGTYAEAIYVEDNWGYEAGQEYINSYKKNIRYDRPIIGKYNVNNDGSGDMYPKGALMLNTLRHVINNDELWFLLIKKLYNQFKYQIVTSNDIETFINGFVGQDFSYFFDQYLRSTKLPTLDLVFNCYDNNITMRYRWKTKINNFEMPIIISTSKDKSELFYPTNNWKSVQLKNSVPEDIKTDKNKYLIDVSRNVFYKVNDSSQSFHN